MCPAGCFVAGYVLLPQIAPPKAYTLSLPLVSRRTDKQPMTVPDEEDEDEDVQELALDDVLMLDQEPEPGIDLDDAERPRLSRV